MTDSEHFGVALADVTSGFAAFRPPKRMTVSQGAAENLVINQPGGYVGPFSPTETPYMVEPMNMLASRVHETVCFVGPARTGKTMALLDGFMAHAVINDPGDMLIVQMTQDKAREFSKTRVDRAIRHSPNLKSMMSNSKQDDNTHDKGFKHGMWLRIGWPTVSQLSSSDYRYVVLTDYDRMPDDIDGEGSPYALGLKRTTTFMSRGMCGVESSPGRPITDPNWQPATPHEAPPTTGILGIYNRGDRRRWYWTCPDCSEAFEAEPGLGLFRLPPDEQLIEIVREADIDKLATEYNRIVCPHCGVLIGPRSKHKLNEGGRWLSDGQTIVNGEVVGEGMTSTIASYWLGGVAATYQSWRSLLTRYFQGLREYALSGSELTLQTTVNTDQGMPYMSRAMVEASKGNSHPSDRAADFPRYVVPDEARFLVAAVDVQGGTNSRFVVQVHAVGPHMEQWLVDRYEIKESMRPGMGTEMAPIDPASYAEDWDALTEKCVRATYRTSVEGRELRVLLTVCDSGGEDGVTDKAYAWYRRIRREGLARRVMLVKGASAKGAPMIKETLVGNRNGKEKGDIPLYMLNPNLLKDAVDAGIRRVSGGPGALHFPSWLPKPFFDELKSEVRQANGIWMQIRKRNEGFDLCGYIRAGCLRLGADKLKWDGTVPKWAATLDLNSEIMLREERQEMKENTLVEAPKPRLARPARRAAPSAYLSA